MTDEQRSWREWPEYKDILNAVGKHVESWMPLDALCARVWWKAQQTYSKRVIPKWANTGAAAAEHTRADAAAAQRDRLAAALPDALQARVAEWHDRNFGDAPQLARALIICEEVGELAHVVLKQTQNIRPETATDAHLRDAMGDIVIALCALAASRGWSLWECVTETAEVVLARDWNADREARAALADVSDTERVQAFHERVEREAAAAAADPNVDAVLLRARRRDEAYRAMVDDLVLRGDDVAAALAALMADDLPETDVEAIEHCNAVVEKWIESRALALARQVEEG